MSNNNARSGKKIRQQQQQQQIQPIIDKTPIHSGSFMVTFTEQNEDSYDMPIASPDAANNEVPVAPAKNDETINKEKNNSLKNLIKYLTTAYSPNLTSPKWKNFKGLKLTVKDKIRLNNVIWRTWFQEFGIRDPNKRRKAPMCQFSNPLETDINSSSLVLEGKYWKRKLDSITNEYKKWREFSRQNLKSTKTQNDENDFSKLFHQNHTTSSTILSKQENSNRCRSPSPGLFQDLELYNFSDTLFTTIIEDPGDSIIATYPDLFQPELNPNFRMYPNFDFLDCEFDILANEFDKPSGSQNTTNTTTTANTTSVSTQNTFNSQVYTNSSTASSNSSSRTQSNQDSIQMINFNQIPQAQPIDYSNFDTLATVAAQTPHLSQFSRQQQQQNTFFANTNPYQAQPQTTTTYHQDKTKHANNTIRDLLAMKTILKPDAYNQSPQQTTHLQTQKSLNNGYHTQTSNEILSYPSAQIDLNQQPINKTIRQIDNDVQQTSVGNKRARLPVHQTNGKSKNETINVEKQAPKGKRLKTNEKIDNSSSNGTFNSSSSFGIQSINEFSPTLIVSPSASTSNFTIMSNSSENLVSLALKNAFKGPIFIFNFKKKKTESKRQSSQIKSNNKASTLDTSDTISLKNYSPSSLTNAEHKRRCNIQNGFDQLHTLVPSLRESQNGKTSKAAMLQKTAEYIKELQVIKTQKDHDMEQYKHEIDLLSNQISRLQCELPEDGVYISGNFNRTEKFKQKFNAYCQQRVSENWKFYPFSLILKPLFDNYVSTVNNSSIETLESSTNEWRNRYCSLSQLRPLVSNALRQISTKTSIISEPAKLAQECFSAAFNTYT